MQNGMYVYLEPGVNHIEVTFSASAIAEKGIDGPYMMGLIELVHQDDLGNDLSFRPTVATGAYKASDFAAVAVAFSNEPSAKGVLECDTPTVMLPFEAKRACTVVASATLIGTNGEFIARASATNRCDAAGAQTAEIVFPREALVAAGQQGPFSVGYFALLPLVDGEEPIYSDTFELTGIEWIDWEVWMLEDGVLLGYDGDMPDGCELVVPDGVVGIAPHAFSGRSGLTSVTISSSVMSIGAGAFSGCNGLKSVSIPLGVTNIGSSAFYNCSSLTAVAIPSSVTNIGNSAFSGCRGLESVTMCDGVTSIGMQAFYNCRGLESVTIPSSVTNIGESAFRDCSGLISVAISEGVTRIGNWAFCGCSNLTSVAIPSSVTSIGDFAFYDCVGFESVTIPEGVTSIGQQAFYNCTNLTSVTIPACVKQLSATFPQSYSALTNVTIAAGVTNVNVGVFSNCNMLESISVESGNECYCSVDGILYDKALTSLILCPVRKAGPVAIPDGVVNIRSSAFQGRTRLTSVTIPSSVTSIGSSAFSGCSGLTSVTIPEGVTSIGQSAFYNCSGLTSVTIPTWPIPPFLLLPFQKTRSPARRSAIFLMGVPWVY